VSPAQRRLHSVLKNSRTEEAAGAQSSPISGSEITRRINHEFAESAVSPNTIDAQPIAYAQDIAGEDVLRR